ncbi:flagellar biosynthesis protein FlgN [Oceaniglobus ichthyenteri]|uniref:flagellar biosynthesis protein FlgN n=1 Tax=Oceaniglobus ichthyenteri TaxID=2136177 RepID=UPI000D3DC582|nr:flagellar biosynthesis protein FlgN [Oceaniglobus ichthyenteri]
MNENRTLHQLEQVFDEERRQLVQGNLARLARLADRKEKLLLALQDVKLTKDTLERLSDLSERNQALITAAQDGVRSVRDRLTEIQRGAPVETYSRTGEKSQIEKPVRTLQRRA